MKGFLTPFIIISFVFVSELFSQIPNIENRNKKKIKLAILDTYYRSMSKWDISFQDLLENKSGAACIEWDKMTDTFLSNGIFDALGYSQNIPNKKASQIAAVSGCNKMKDYYQLKGKCDCEVIVVNTENKVILPIKKIDVEKDFNDGVKFFKAQEYNKALKIFKKLSELGDSKSQYNISFMHLKGFGITQNYSRAYYWGLSSKLYGEKKSELIIKQSRLKISKDEKSNLDNELKENLEKIAMQGTIHALLPLAKWHVTVPKKPDYNNAYKWLSIATAFNLKNAKKARDTISTYVNKKDLISIQEDSKDSYDTIKVNILAKKKLDGE